MTALWDHVVHQARLRPGWLAVFGPAGPVSYRAFVRDVEALATELLERGLTRQDVVGLQFGFSYLHLLLIVALDRLSIPSMSSAAETASPPPGATVVIAGPEAPPALGCRSIVMPDPQRPKLGKPDAARLAQLDAPADAVVRLMWSSGTTGGTKGVALTRPVQHSRIVSRRMIRGFGPHTRYFTAMPLASATGYIRAIAVLAAGGSLVLPAPPADFVSLANALGVTLTSGSPTLLRDLLGRGGGHRLATVAYFEVLGDHLPAKLIEQTRLLLTPNLWINYGSTETDGISVAEATVCLADPSAAGYLLPWCDTEIVDDNDRPLPAGREGLLRTRGPSVVAGYLDNEAATRRNFRGGWFYPGDFGAVLPDGMLRILGRVEDVIVHDGMSLSPVPFEEAIRGLAGVRDVAVFALAEGKGAPQTCAALVLEPGADAGAIRAATVARLGSQAPTRMFVIESLPRNAGGKVLRRELADLARRSVKA